MPKNNHNSNQDLQITELKTDVGWIKKDMADVKSSVNKIETNCIPTINSALLKLDTNQKILLWFMMAIIIALIGLFFK